MEKLKGTLAQVRTHKPDSGWCVGILASMDCVVGEILTPQIGCEYEFTGSWNNHPRFGKQFKFTEFTVEMPSSQEAVRQYLIDNLLGCGPIIATKIIDRCGERALEIIRTVPEQIADIRGIKSAADEDGKLPIKLRKWSAALQEMESIEKITLGIKDLFRNTRVAKRALNSIIKKYKSNAVDAVKENPYALIKEIKGIGWTVADAVALGMGWNRTESRRILAGAEHVLNEAAREGNTCMPGLKLIEESTTILGIDRQVVQQALQGFLNTGELILEKPMPQRISLPKFFSFEQLIARRLAELSSYEATPIEADLSGLAEDQEEAVKVACNNRLAVITGGPGTGKTYSIRRIISSFGDRYISLAAPTGRAAKRMEEQTERAASTIHRLLEAMPMPGGTFAFRRGPDLPLDAEVVVIDEISMLDTEMAACLLSAIDPKKTRLILVGDDHQLPSVGPGTILRDLLAAEHIPSATLSIIKRQSESCTIPAQCAKIKEGVTPDLETNNPDGDFFFAAIKHENDIRDYILTLCATALPQRYNINPMDIQIISARKSESALSCETLNPQLQMMLNSMNDEIPEYKFREGDKVLQTRNDYDNDIMNGDLGYVEHISPAHKLIVVKFENPERLVELNWKTNALDLAYALTVHKCQGAEFPIIVIPIHSCMGSQVLQRNLLYTAVSRASRICVIVGDPQEMEYTVRRNAQIKRESRLYDLIEAMPNVREAMA